MKKWQQSRQERHAAMMVKKREEQQLAQDNQLSDGAIRQHLAGQPIALPSVTAYPNGIVLYDWYESICSSTVSCVYDLSKLPLDLSPPSYSCQQPLSVPSSCCWTSNAGMLLMQNALQGEFLCRPPLVPLANVSSVSTSIRSPSPAKSQLAGTKRSTQQAYPNISSLLQSTPIASPPSSKQRKSPSNMIHTNGENDWYNCHQMFIS